MGNNAPHLCGTIRGAGSSCPHLIVTGKEPERDLISGRVMQPFAVYCLQSGRPKKLGNKSDWTGRTPTWCQVRKEWEEQNGSKK